MAIIPRKLKKIEDEVWKEIPNCDIRYELSNYGRVKSFAFNKKEGQILKYGMVNGFRQVGLSMDNTRRRFYIHKLVAEIWLKKPSDKHIYVTHLDENLLNNYVKNLEWHTKESLAKRHRELVDKKYSNPNSKKSTRNSKLKVADVMLLKYMLEQGVVQAKIAKMFCISEMQVTRIKRGENWGKVKAGKTFE